VLESVCVGDHLTFLHEKLLKSMWNWKVQYFFDTPYSFVWNVNILNPCCRHAIKNNTFKRVLLTLIWKLNINALIYHYWHRQSCFNLKVYSLFYTIHTQESNI
jgi:hypothetical protein